MVDGASDYFLSISGFTLDEYRVVGGGHGLNLLTQATHGRTVSDNGLPGIASGHQVTQAFIFM